jgi:hypothetical protein
MDAFDQLLLIVEVAVALSGFAGIVGSFQNKPGVKLSRGDVLGLELIITLSLITAVCAILPVAISNFGIGDATVWTICSGIGVFAYVVTIFKIKIKFRKLVVANRVSRIIFQVFFVAAYLTAVANLLNVLDVRFHREYGPYFVALVLPNCVSAYMFVRLVLRPLWRTIHEQETTGSYDASPT